MTEQEKELRQNSTMKLFNLYLDDMTKLKVLKKLKTLGLDEQKGVLSATIRVLLNMFAETPDSDNEMIARIKDEYLFTTRKNKRSKL